MSRVRDGEETENSKWLERRKNKIDNDQIEVHRENN